MNPVTVPKEWNSAYRPIEYEFYFSQVNSADVDDDGGFARFTLPGAFGDSTPIVGEQIYVYGIYYTGYHTITSVASSTVFTTSTVYDTDETTGIVKHIWLPEIEIYKGYDTGESLDTELPIELVASFIPSASPEITIRFDISGYIQSIFTTIESPTIGLDVNMFNRFRLKIDGDYLDHYQALNSTITTEDLNDIFVNSSNCLSTYEPILYGCGKTIISQIYNGKVYNKLAINGTII